MSAGPALWGSAQAHAEGSTKRYVGLSGDDSGDCTDPVNPCATIDHAVDMASNGDTISIGAGTFDQSASITKSVTLVGGGRDQTIIKGDADASIDVAPDETTAGPLSVTIKKLAVSGNTIGDGIYASMASVKLEDCDVSRNSDNGVDLWDDRGGATTVTISRCSIVDNERDGVALDADPDEAPAAGPQASIDHSVISGNGIGGVVVEVGSAVIKTSTLDGNTGAGVVADGDGTSVTVTDSTISNTEPFAYREGSTYGAGVVVLTGGTAVIDTSTLSGNTGQGVLSLGGNVTVTNSTITGTKIGTDSEFPSGAVAVHEDSPALKISGTLLADNDAPNCVGDIADDGYNLSDTADCSFDTTTGSINGGTAKLAVLGDNGGPTFTQLPAKGSDAIDAIPVGSAGCTSTGTDQRSMARLAGSKCDIGAVEVAQPPIVVTPATLPHGTVGTDYTANLQASGGLGAPYAFTADPDSLPPGLALSADGQITGTPSQAGTYRFTIAVDDPTYQDFVIVIDDPSVTSTTSSSSTTSVTSSSATSETSAASTALASTTGRSVEVKAASSSATTPPSAGLADTGVHTASTVGLGVAILLLGMALLAWNRIRLATR